MSKTEEAYNLIRGEMCGAWVYLSAYVEFFEHPDTRRQKVLELTAPGFFLVVKASLAENLLLKLARLMDPTETGGKKNMTFAALFDLGDPLLKEPYCGFCAIQYEWKSGKYKPIKDYRNQLSAHNDRKAVRMQPQDVLTRLDHKHWLLIKELFKKLWQVLAAIHLSIYGSSLCEPSYENLDCLPTRLFAHLGRSLLLSEVADEDIEDESSEIFRRMSQFEYSRLGEDTPIRLVGDKHQC